jgi:hypothetical protein
VRDLKEKDETKNLALLREKREVTVKTGMKEQVFLSFSLVILTDVMLFEYSNL